MRSSTARLVTGVASNPKASPHPSSPPAVVTFTSSESTGGRAASPPPARNAMRSGNVSILAMASASIPRMSAGLAPVNRRESREAAEARGRRLAPRPWETGGMADSFAERFAAVRDAYGPLVLGADPHGPLLARWGLTDDADGLERFTDIVLAAAAGSVGLVKPQSAFYERHGWRGIRALTRLTGTPAPRGCW